MGDQTTVGLRVDIIDALKAAPGTYLYEGSDGLLYATNPCPVLSQPLVDAYRLEEAGLLVPKWPHPTGRQRGSAWLLALEAANAR